jgi:hypothetical protein
MILMSSMVLGLGWIALQKQKRKHETKRRASEGFQHRLNPRVPLYLGLELFDTFLQFIQLGLDVRIVIAIDYHGVFTVWR